MTLLAFLLFTLSTISTGLAYTYTQKLETPTGFFWDRISSENAAPFYRWYNEDWGWNHQCPTGIWINSAQLSIRAYDVDVPSEVDQIYLDGDYFGDLGGSSTSWSLTTFNIPYSYLTDGWLGVWMDIDATSSWMQWGVTLDYSELSVEYSYLMQIDIKPGSWPNSFNIKQKGVLPVAVLTTDSFDATTLDPVTVHANGVSPLKWSEEDVDNDGDVDLILHYNSQEIAATLVGEDGDSVPCYITGFTVDGLEYKGADQLRILKKGK